MSLANHTTEELVSLCVQKNQKAQFEIYNRYSKAMYNVAYRIVKDFHFAEDVMQEGFLKAFIKINDYKKEVAFGAWLKRIIVNTSIDFYKKNNQFKKEDFEKEHYKIENYDPENDESINFNDVKVKQILETIATLKNSHSIILTLFFIEGYDYEEISSILNISSANCRTTISRAKESLRKKLLEK